MGKLEDNYIKMTQTPVKKLILKMALPTIIGMLITSLYSLTDTFFVSKLNNSNMTSAIGVIFSFISVVQALGFLFGYGSGNSISNLLGKKEELEAKKFATVGFYLSALCGLIVALAGFLFLPFLIKILGGAISKDLQSACTTYVFPILFSVPFTTSAVTLNNQLRLQGKAKEGALGLIIGMGLNMFLDPILIFGLGMGIKGAGIATSIGQIVGFVVLFKTSMKTGNIGPMITPDFKLIMDCFSVKKTVRVVYGGCPNFIRQGVTSISCALLNQAAGVYGKEALAAFTVNSRYIFIIYAIAVGLGQGFQPVCAFNYGAKKYDRVKEGFDFCVKVTTIYLLVFAIISFWCAPFIMSAFSKEESVVVYGIEILRMQTVSLPFLGFYILVGMVLQNTGNFGKATFETILRQGIFFIPLVLVLPRLFGFVGVAMVAPTSDILSFIAALFILGAFKANKVIEKA